MKTVSLVTRAFSVAFVALAPLSCTTAALPAAPLGPSAIAETAAPPAPTSTGRVCTLRGSSSAIEVTAHLDESPADLAARGSFRLCHRGQCWDGTFTAPSAPDGLPKCKVPSWGELERWCAVAAEDSGARLWLMLMDRDFTDGDRIALRVTVGGAQRIDVDRRQIYTVSNPNGPGCGETKGARVDLWPGSRSGVTCSSQECDPIVRFTSKLTRTKDSAGPTRLTACKNGDCKTSEVPALWGWDDANDRAVWLEYGGGTVQGIDGSDVNVSPMDGRTLTSPAPVTIEFSGDPRRYKNGDEYTVEWKSMTGRVLLSEKRVVTYDESEPGGPGCSPVTCKRKVF